MLGEMIMEPKVIFEIPVYSMSEEKYYKKQETSNESSIKHFLELNDEIGDYERWLKRFNLPQSIWKYNQIVGYIQIIIKGKDIIFDLWLCKDKRYFYNTTKKHFIEPMPANGLHFFTNTMTDREIKIEIERFLKIIEKEIKKKNMYLDKTIYNNLVNNINIKNML